MKSNANKILPVGVQNFESLIHDGYLYVDKTEQIWRLTHSGRHYDLSPENYLSTDNLKARLDWHLSQWESICGKEDVERSLSARFENCIMRAVTQTGNRVAVLIVELLKRNNYMLSDLTTKPIDSTALDSKDDNGQSILPLLFQSGYLTIRDYEAGGTLYYMDFPNDEVRSGFFRYILPFYTSVKKEESMFAISQFVDELCAGKAEDFLKRLQSFFADYQYDAQTTPEAHFRNVLFVLCKLLGLQVDAEYMTSDGRIDLLIRTPNYIYIIECKLDSSAKLALQQIENKSYSLPWSVDEREKILIGLNFSSSTRRPDSWLIRTSADSAEKGGQTGGQTLELVFNAIFENPKITRQQLSDLLKINPSAIQKHIEKLKKQNRIRRVGGERFGGFWEITPTNDNDEDNK